MKTEDSIKLLPQKKPFLFIDYVEFTNDNKIICINRFESDEFFYKGHFPHNPITPGVLLIESMAQSAQLFCSLSTKNSVFGYLVKVDKCSFHQVVKPNNEIQIVTALESTIGDFRSFSSQVLNKDNKLIAKAKFTLRLIND